MLKLTYITYIVKLAEVGTLDIMVGNIEGLT